MKVFLLLFLLFVPIYCIQSQTPTPSTDTLSILAAQQQLEKAEILYSKESLNYAKMAVDLGAPYFDRYSLAWDWKAIVFQAVRVIREKDGANSTLYKWALRRLGYPANIIVDSQLALEEAEKTKVDNPALYAKRLIEQARTLFKTQEKTCIEVTIEAVTLIESLPPTDKNRLSTYAEQQLAPFMLNLAQAKIALDGAQQHDSLKLAALKWQFAAAAIEHDQNYYHKYAYDSVYYHLNQALLLYETLLGQESDAYQTTYNTFSPAMLRYHVLERPFLEQLQQHQTNNDDFIVLLRSLLFALEEDGVPPYEAMQVFEWVLNDIRTHHGVADPYYRIVTTMKNNWDLDDAEREIAIQKNLTAAYLEEYGRESLLYLESMVKLGNLYAEDGDDVLAEVAFHQAFDQLELLDEQGVAAPQGEQDILQYYWSKVLPTWRAVLIKEHNLYVIQELYGLQSAEYWKAYFELSYVHHEQNILRRERGAKYLEKGLKIVPNDYLNVALEGISAILRLDPEFNIIPIVDLLPKRVEIPALEELLLFPMDSMRREYGVNSVAVAELMEVLADAYFYDTTQAIHATIALERYQAILELYDRLGEQDEYEELLDKMTRNLTRFSPWTVEQVNTLFEDLLGKIKQDMGELERYYLTSVERYANWLYDSEQLIASEQYFEQIVAYFEKDDYYLKLEGVYKKDKEWYLRTLDVLAQIYRKTGRYYKAKATYKKLWELAPALSSSREETLWIAIRSANDIGDLSYRLNDYEKAMKAFNTTLAILEKAKKVTPLFDPYQNARAAKIYVSTLHGKGRLLFESKQEEEARVYYQEALDLVNAAQSPIALKEVGYLLTALAALAVYDYEDEKAAQYYTHALQYIKGKEERSIAHLAFAKYYQTIGQDSLAEPHLSAALSTDLKRVQDNYTALSEQERLLFLQPISKRFDIFLEFAVRQQDPDLLLQAFNSHLIIKGLSLETSNNLQSVCNVTQNTVLRKKCLEMQSLRKELSGATDLPMDVQKNLDTRIASLEKEIGLSSKDLREIYDKNNRNLNFVDLKRLLYNMGTPVDSTMAIDFLLVPEMTAQGFRQQVYYAAIVIPRHPYPHFVRLATQEELADVLAAEVTPHGSNYISDNRESRYLYELVWEPLLPYINKATDLHLCPTGILSRIAFGTLRTGDYSNSRIMDRWSIHYYGALRDLLHLKADKGAEGSSAVLIGGVKFDLTSAELNFLVRTDSFVETKPSAALLPVDGTRGQDFNYLQGTLTEVEAISQLFPNDWVVKLLSGSLATEENLTDIANEAPDILHIATHGYFFPTPPKKRAASNNVSLRKGKKGMEDNIAASYNPLLRSGLALAGINRVWKGGASIEGLEDGILTALEVSNLDLFNTKLVVLSACETGRGDIDNTEGIMGLRRAFKTAGAQQLIISLWKVPDAQTAELMQLFYQRYLSGTSAHEAFEFAQQEMSKRYSNPYYWAAFLLIE